MHPACWHGQPASIGRARGPQDSIFLLFPIDASKPIQRDAERFGKLSPCVERQIRAVPLAIFHPGEGGQWDTRPCRKLPEGEPSALP